MSYLRVLSSALNVGREAVGKSWAGSGRRVAAGFLIALGFTACSQRAPLATPETAETQLTPAAQASCLNRSAGERLELGSRYDETIYLHGYRRGVQVDARGGFFTAPHSRREGQGRLVFSSVDNGGLCLSGGVYGFNLKDSADWEPYFHASHAIQLYDTPDAVIEGVAVLVAGDAVSFKDDTDGWTFRDSYVRHAGDDGVENDRFNNGLVDDVLIDWAFTGFSCRKERVAPRTVTMVIRDSLLALRPQEGTYGESQRPGGPNRVGHNELFKWTKNSRTGCKLVLQNNTFLLTHSAGYIDPADDPEINYEVIETAACRGKKNTIVYLGDNDAYRERLEAANPTCFDIVTDLEVWDDARDAWFDRHPEFERFRDEEPEGASL